MKVTEHLARADGPLISFEIIPPLRGGSFAQLVALIDDLVRFRPPFIDITSHAAQAIYEETAQGIVRRVKRKRPGTIGVCAVVQSKYGVDAVPHVLCTGFTREETEDFLIELKYLGIENVLAIRGDENGFVKPLQHGRTANRWACELVDQVAAMNRGEYLAHDLLDAEPSGFCIGVAGYPEKHFEAPNVEADVRYTKTKVDAGADYIVTQMFFDNRHYFAYLERCRAAGITVPIIPGLKVITGAGQVSALPKNFYCEIPATLADEIERTPAGRAVDVGVEWAIQQSRELIAHGVPALHFYVMSSSKAVGRVVEQLG